MTKQIDVVGAVIIRDGTVLCARRGPDGNMAGMWEFPGGKLEPGETVEQALRRELQEELGIVIGSAQVWKVTEHDYPHALVRLHWCRVTAWTGAFEMREAQQMCWQHWPIAVRPVLPGALPVLQWLAQERGLEFDPEILQKQ